MAVVQLMNSPSLKEWTLISDFKMKDLLVMCDIAEHLRLEGNNLFSWLHKNLIRLERMDIASAERLMNVVDTLRSRDWNPSLQANVIANIIEKEIVETRYAELFNASPEEAVKIAKWRVKHLRCPFTKWLSKRGALKTTP